jgi:Uma2 family endonuclease
MSSVPQRTSWRREEFLAWAAVQEGRYEFDGVQPVAMTGGTIPQEFIAHSLYRALDRRLPEGGPCRVLGPNAGVATRSTFRYPDAVITCSKQDPVSRQVAGAVVVFEIISERTAATDRILKVREYATVASILRYVMVESTLAGLTVLARKQPDEVWGTSTLTLEDVLQIPEVGVEIPVVELYRDVTFPPAAE